jgi:uncharacterized lipoprotein YajG
LTLKKLLILGTFFVSSCSLARHTLSITFAARTASFLESAQGSSFFCAQKNNCLLFLLSRENLVLLLHFPLCQITKEHCCMFLSFLTR